MLLVGVDITEISRIERAATRTPRFLKRVYTESELSYCYSKKNPYPSLAARWAAKEAFHKLHPRLSSQVRFTEVEVGMGPGGKPELNLYGWAREKAWEVELREIDVSLSHTRENAIAVVVARIG
ncbi:MAG: holo-ACP synthase [Syntrophothermus sp.]|nr:holo-ACP synthase [Syntrophothermus sp.]